MTLVLFLLAACSGGDCSATFSKLCAHQLDCGTIGDYDQCVRDFQEDYVCNPKATEEQVDTCNADLESASCVVKQPSSCAELFCDANLGCDVTTSQTCIDNITQTTTSTLPLCSGVSGSGTPTGATGATGDTAAR